MSTASETEVDVDLFEIFTRQPLQLAVSHRTIAPTPEQAIDRFGDKCLYQPKADGHRCLAIADGDEVRLLSRGGRDVSAQYPEITAALTDLPHPVVLDGELIHLDSAGRFAPWDLSGRANRTGGFQHAAHHTPVVFWAFDLLWSDRWDMRRLPLERRLKTLDELDFPDRRIQIMPWSDDGHLLWATVQELGLEGLVAKRRTGRYSGSRNGDWVKLKKIDRVSLIVGAVVAGKSRALGSIELYALNDLGEPQHVGTAGTGFTEVELADVARRLNHYATDPGNLDPVIVDVEFSGQNPDGSMRFASFIRVREDLDFSACRLDQDGLNPKPTTEEA